MSKKFPIEPTELISVVTANNEYKDFVANTMRVLITFTLLFLLSACQNLAEFISVKESIKKSPNDSKQYHSFFLDNELEVLVISDPETDKAAASLDVNIGSADDPAEFNGLAHFLEHMLFLGTETYPEPDEYQKYISEHGGYHNAYTSLEHTNYFFDVQAEFLEEALKRFSSQFTSPLFNEEYVEREVNAVHSEYTAKVKSDGRRLFSVLKEQLASDHPYSNFSVGNKTTLTQSGNEALREALLKFYDKHYSANQMKLVILGKEPLSKLEAYARSMFSAVKNKKTNDTPIELPFFTEGYLPAKVEIQNIKDTRSLMLAFPLPSASKHYQEKPISYLANLIGHEGKGSLLSALKQKGLADSLSAGNQFDTQRETMFVVTVGLTSEGLKNYQQIVELFFSYVDLLNKEGIKKLYFDEQARMLDVSFAFQEKSEPNHYVSALSNQLQYTPANNVLYKHYDLSNYSPDLYKEYLRQIKPSNMLIVLSSKDRESDQQSKWYNAPYKVTKLDPTQIDSLANQQAIPEFTLPNENIFIPDNVALKKIKNVDIPVLEIKKEGLEAWLYPNNEFNTPKSNLFITMRSPVANESARNSNLTELLTQMLKDELNEFSYPAYLAGLNYELYHHMRGITLKVSGYSDKQDVLLKRIIKSIKEVQFSADRFAIKKEKLSRKLNNASKNKPFQQAIAKVQQYLITPSWSEQERLKALSAVSEKDLVNFRDEFLKSLDIAVLSSGNLNKADLAKYIEVINKDLLTGSTVTKVNRAKITQLSQDKGLSYQFNVDHNDTGFVYYFQGKDKSYYERARFSLLAQMLSSDYYNTIRTEKQLGYIVFATNFTLLEVPAVAFIVQSPDANAETLFNESQNFFQTLSINKEDWDEASLQRNKQAVLSKLLKKDNTLYERTNRYWRDLDIENTQFNSNEELAKHVETLAIDDLIPLFDELKNNSARKLIVFTQSKVDPVSLENYRDLKSLEKTNTHVFH